MLFQVTPVNFAHIELNKDWAMEAALQNWVQDCRNASRKTSIDQLRSTVMITNRHIDCHIFRHRNDTMNCAMKPPQKIPGYELPVQSSPATHAILTRLKG